MSTSYTIVPIVNPRGHRRRRVLHYVSLVNDLAEQQTLCGQSIKYSWTREVGDKAFAECRKCAQVRYGRQLNKK